MSNQATKVKKVSTRLNLDGSHFSLFRFNDLVRGGGASLILPLSDGVRKKLSVSADVVNDALIDDQEVYGVTTGFGGMSNQRIGCEEATQLQSNLLTFLAASAGDEIESMHTRGAMLLLSLIHI